MTEITPDMLAGWLSGTVKIPDEPVGMAVAPAPVDFKKNQEISEANKAILENIKTADRPLKWAAGPVNKTTEQYMAEADAYTAELDISTLFEGSADKALTDRIKDLIDMNELIKQKADELDAYQTAFDKEEEALFAKLESENIQGIKVNGKNVFRSTRIWASVPQDKFDAGLEWLNENGFEYIPKTTINTQTLSAAMKEYIEKEGQAAVPDCIKITPKNHLSIRKA